MTNLSQGLVNELVGFTTLLTSLVSIEAHLKYKDLLVLSSWEIQGVTYLDLRYWKLKQPKELRLGINFKDVLGESFTL